MRYVVVVCLAMIFVCTAEFAGHWAGVGGVQEAQEQTLSDPSPTIKASSETERKAWNKVAREEKTEKKSKAAEEYLEKFSDGAYAPYAHEIVAVYSLGRNETLKFKKHAEIAVAILPESIMLQVELAVVYAEQQEPDAAIRHGERVLPILTTLVTSEEVVGTDLEKRRLFMMADTNYALGTAHLFNGFNSRDRLTMNRAIAYLETAVHLNKQDERSHFRLAFGYEITRQAGNAMVEYARTVALQGSNAGMAREYLEKVYLKKQGSLDGIENFIASQKSQMNAPSLSSEIATPLLPEK